LEWRREYCWGNEGSINPEIDVPPPLFESKSSIQRAYIRIEVIFLGLKYNILGFQDRISKMLYLPLHFGGILKKRFLNQRPLPPSRPHSISLFAFPNRKTAPLSLLLLLDLNVNI